MTVTHDTLTHSGLLTGTFRDRESAERAYNALVDHGYSPKDISVMMSDKTRKEHFSDDNDTTKIGNKAAAGGLTGAAVGGTIGVIAALLAAAGTIAIPGLGIVLAGPIAAGLAGLGAGAAAGGLVGTLIGLGIPEERAKVYQTDIENGFIVVGVRPRSDDDAMHLEREWTGYHAENVFR